MKILDCEQRSEEWFRARLGIPTASEFGAVLGGGRGAEAAKARRTYMYTLAGERMTEAPAEDFDTGAMRRGRAMEPAVRAMYELMADETVRSVGFIRIERPAGAVGASPDGLVGEDGLLEIKTIIPRLLIPLLLHESPEGRAEALRAKHRPQVQGQLWISGREWCDLMLYWPRMPPLIQRIDRDERYIASLAEGVDRFNLELASLVETLRNFGTAGYDPAERLADVTDLVSGPPAF